MLPGNNNSPTAFAAAGMITEAQAVAGVDVLAVDASIQYYLDYSVVRRLHDEVIAPARLRGYQQIWLVGSSMGGFGCLLYAQQYPADIAGLVLLAPFLGRAFQADIAPLEPAAAWLKRLTRPLQAGYTGCGGNHDQA